MDVDVCMSTLRSSLEDSSPSKLIVCCHPSYSHMSAVLIQRLAAALKTEVIEAKSRLVDFNNANASDDNVSMLKFFSLGGQLVPRELLDQQFEVLYIGEQSTQLMNILLRLPEVSVIQYSPSEFQLTRHLGKDSKSFHERYGGVSRVQQSTTIGIIVGSMGLQTEITRAIVHRLQTLIKASEKHFYTFVMGRLNETKLCNFPEIDVFCLIASEDNAFIKPKTFPVPVITPYELEVGLGCREWTSMYEVNVDAILNDDISVAIQRLPKHKSIDSEVDREDGSNLPNALDMYGSREISTFLSVAVDRFNDRSYRGLEYDNANSEDLNVQPGLHGTAANYRRNI